MELPLRDLLEVLPIVEVATLAGEQPLILGQVAEEATEVNPPPLLVPHHQLQVMEEVAEGEEDVKRLQEMEKQEQEQPLASCA